MNRSSENPRISESKVNTNGAEFFSEQKLNPLLSASLGFLLLTLLSVSVGIAFSYIFRFKLEGYLVCSSDFFDFFRNERSFLYKIAVLSYQDLFFLILTSLSAFTFICIPLNCCLISTEGFLYGICMGILLFLGDAPSYTAAYITATSAVVLSVTVSSVLSYRHNRAFTEFKSSKKQFWNTARLYVTSISPVYIFYIAAKIVFCTWLSLK